MALPAEPPDDAEAGIEAARDMVLVERVLRGDAEAFGDLVERHMRRAFSIAYRVLEHREDAQDVVQDAFLRALERIETLDLRRPFRPWLYRIVVNQALNYRRARSLRTTEPLPVHAASGGRSPEEEAGTAVLRRHLRAALDELPERQRLVVQLADLEGLKSTEIGEILEIPPGTVRWQLHEARRTLRSILEALKGET